MENIVLEQAARAVRARQRIRGLVYETPLLPARSDTSLLFKAENFQHTGSFKFRGAASKMTAIAQGQGLITASSGNHGIASAKAAALTGNRLTVVLPKTVTRTKLARIEAFGVEILLEGDESGQAEDHAQVTAKQRGLAYVSPYNDPEIIAGQGTIALELLEQHARIDNVFVAMGGGGLISGIASVLKSYSPATRVFGVAADSSAALAASMKAGRVVEVEHHPTLADGVAGGIDTDSMTLPLAKATIDEVVHCSEAEIAAALRDLILKENLIVEGAAGLAFAGFLKVAARASDAVNVVVLCGANVDPQKILALAVN
ncbi:MAG TPA: pyridoxal-phosphate dependent enzyme [Nordella sp.]|nr:pyridoxal-phosphate dependent enzyme [Nordella sp.]